MTAEIAILNRSAVALAADSAVTVGKERVWKNTNKLFSLSSRNDIGVMIFGTGDFCGVAWEIVIKQFRKHIGPRIFKKLGDCTKEFNAFLGALNVPGSEVSNLNLYFVFLRSISQCRKASSDPKALKKRKQFLAEIERLTAEAQSLPIVFGALTRDSFAKAHSKTIKSFLEEQSGVHVTSIIHSKMITLCFERARRQYKSSFETGVVFAGYGEDEILPSIQQWSVDGKYGQAARAWIEREHDLNSEASVASYVIPFAQSDIAYLFMEGMQLDYLEFIEKTTKGLLKEKSERLINDYVPANSRTVEVEKQNQDNKILVDSLMDEFKKMRKDEAIQPMLRVISSLPKEEMAAMAEALVEITSLRRKIDSKIESVGGPVDVAVISKADGFVWIKRKHYFSMDLNHDFMVRRKRRFEGDAA